MSRFTRLRNLCRPAALERELDEELRFHLEQRIAHNVGLGMNRRDAEADAYGRFGAVDAIKSAMRRTRSVRRSSVLSALAAVTLVALVAASLPLATARRVYELSDSVSAPVPVETPRPEYTGAAKQARIQGAVRVRCVVQPAGVCSDVAIVDSLDQIHGLDDEAIRAAGQWRFRPGLLDGTAVPTRIELEFSFALR